VLIFVGAPEIGTAVGDIDGLAVGVRVGVAVVGLNVVLIFVGAPEIGIAVGDIVGLAVGVRVGPAVVGLNVRGPQRVASYVAVGIEAQSALVALKNPISFHVGRIDMSTSQT